ncbi:MAG: YitT family protein [Candidatus Onthomorpha sp.]|nr:YitT family protein [Bacteroidales bacterium]MDY3977756.1 YitT family protein [Candidatus Onthomorpha sp.]MCI5716266.1 YitT family protein [Bacteroidales bacterium]MCI6417394.1 YitT family protein [Bacteroidales bacterium]MCI6644678.1 YitT family protein [Bacteroidales bacterium]
MNTLLSVKKRPVWKIVMQYLFIVLGIMLYCFSWTVFLVPKHIIGGGVVGLATIVYYLTGFPMGITNFVVNGILLIIGYRILGGKFGLNTIIGMTTASLSLILFQQVLEVNNMEYFKFENMELFTRAVLGGALSGIGIGICFVNGGNSGGSDIIALIVTKYRNVSPGSVILVVDAIVIAGTLLVPNGLGVEGMVYCYIVLVTFTYTLDLVVEGRKQTYQITIMSQLNEQIADAIGNEVKRGVTLLNGWGWYTKKDQKVLLVIAQKKDKVEIMRLVKAIDPNAFISVAKTQGVYGKNFDTIKN